MIEVRFISDERNNSWTVTAQGHAGAGTFGSDLVCAASSMLLQTLAEYIAEYWNSGTFLHRKPVLSFDEGTPSIFIYFVADSEKSFQRLTEGVWLTRTGFRLLQNEYPNNVKLVETRLPDDQEMQRESSTQTDRNII